MPTPPTTIRHQLIDLLASVVAARPESPRLDDWCQDVCGTLEDMLIGFDAAVCDDARPTPADRDEAAFDSLCQRNDSRKMETA